MKFIQEWQEGMRISGVYLVKSKTSAMTKNGKPYENVILQDKTGSIDAKVWEPDSPGIEDFEALDYIDVIGDVTRFAGALQISLKRVRKAREGEYTPADYLPVSEKNTEQMLEMLQAYVQQVQNRYLRELLEMFYVRDEEFLHRFSTSSAAKSVHHGFIGGLLEHTLGVVRICAYMADHYPVLNRDLLLTAAIFHDIGKTKELSAFPKNDYTDDGQLLGHIVIGTEMIHDAAAKIEHFPAGLEMDLKHCILAHHGELEYGSPKKPALAEAVALNLADNLDARMETITELLKANAGKKGGEWLGYNRLFESNIRKTGELPEN